MITLREGDLGAQTNRISMESLDKFKKLKKILGAEVLLDELSLVLPLNSLGESMDYIARKRNINLKNENYDQKDL